MILFLHTKETGLWF